MSTRIAPATVQDSLRLLASSRYELGIHFYGRLFGRFPELESYFSGSTVVQLERKFATALRTIMQSVTSPDALDSQVVNLRRIHEPLDLKPEYFPQFAEVLIESLRYYAGRGWTEEVELAWQAALDPVIDALQNQATS